MSTTIRDVPLPSPQSWQSVASLIDHTLLKPDATRTQIVQLCEEAGRYRFACAFVNPFWTNLAIAVLAGTGVNVGTAIGFPLGANLTATKRAEAMEMVRMGARELDMVLNIGALKSGDRDFVMRDIRAVAEITHDAGATLKVVLETCLLTIDEKIVACELAVAAKADFVKTSTGFSTGGATTDDVALMRGVVGHRAGVKASGGVRTAADLFAMVDAGANRIGTGAGVKIMSELGAE